MDQSHAGPRSVRLTFRARFAALEKLFAIARENEWTNAAGEPNLSAAINYLVEKSSTKKFKSATRTKAHEDAIAYLTKEDADG